jgi:hypothetical protein
MTTPSTSRPPSNHPSPGGCPATPGWQPPIPLQGREAVAIRDLLINAPRRVGEAEVAGSAMWSLILWWYSEDREFDLKRMLSASSLTGFLNFLALEGAYEQSTMNAYGWALDRVGRRIGPDQPRERRALGRTPAAMSPYSLPYDDDEVWAFFLLAWAQRSARLRDGLLAVLYLTLGVGLPTGDVWGLAGADVRRAGDGSVKVRVSDRWLTVQARYAAGLLALAERVGRRSMVPTSRTTGEIRTADFIHALVAPAGTAAPDIQRLAATYRWWLSDQFHLDAIVEQCGPNASIHLAEVHTRMLRRPSAGAASPPAPVGDLEDGPWAPDWPAKHHRPSSRSRMQVKALRPVARVAGHGEAVAHGFLGALVIAFALLCWSRTTFDAKVGPSAPGGVTRN